MVVHLAAKLDILAVEVLVVELDVERADHWARSWVVRLVVSMESYVVHLRDLEMEVSKASKSELSQVDDLDCG